MGSGGVNLVSGVDNVLSEERLCVSMGNRQTSGPNKALMPDSLRYPLDMYVWRLR